MLLIGFLSVVCCDGCSFVFHLTISGMNNPEMEDSLMVQVGGRVAYAFNPDLEVGRPICNLDHTLCWKPIEGQRKRAGFVCSSLACLAWSA